MSMNGFGFTSQKSGRKGSGPNRENVRNERTTFPDVARRQASAKLRQAEAAKRTPEQQLARLDAANLPAVKERAKLAKRIAARDAKTKAAIVSDGGLKPINTKNLDKRKFLEERKFASKGEERRIKSQI